jgi:hypothetical protein
LVCKIFLSFSGVLVWSVRTVSLSVRTGMVLSFGRFIFGVRTGLELCRPDDPCTASRRALASSCGRLLYIVRTRATSLLLSEAARVRTSLKHSPDGDPTVAIKGPDRRSILHTPHNPSFWQLVSKICELLVFLLLLLVFLRIISRSKYSF